MDKLSSLINFKFNAHDRHNYIVRKETTAKPTKKCLMKFSTLVNKNNPDKNITNSPNLNNAINIKRRKSLLRKSDALNISAMSNSNNNANNKKFLQRLSRGKLEVSGVFSSTTPKSSHNFPTNNLESYDSLASIQNNLKKKIQEMRRKSNLFDEKINNLPFEETMKSTKEKNEKDNLDNSKRRKSSFSINNGKKIKKKSEQIELSPFVENKENHKKQCSKDLFRIFERKKIVYDSMSDETSNDELDENIFLYISLDDKFILIFDSITMILSIYSLIYIPYNLATSRCLSNFNFFNIINYFLDIIYIIDLVISFFRPYYNIDEQLIINNNKIILNYLSSCFLFDFICSIPFYSIFRYFYKSQCYDFINFSIILNNIYRIFEILKILKLIKIFSKKVNGAMEKLTIILDKYQFFDNRDLFSLIFFSLCSFHFTTCIHIFVSRNSYPNWILEYKLNNCSFSDVYFSSLYFIVMTLSTVGYGDITGKSLKEFIFQIILLIVGIIAYSWSISSISNYIQEKNKLRDVFNYNVKILEDIKHKYSEINKTLYSKIYRHLEYIYFKQTKNQDSLIDSLPFVLKNDLLTEMFKPVINNLNFFKNFKNSNFVLKIIPKLHPILADKNDILLDKGEIIEHMILVKDGRLTLEVKIDINNPEESVNELIHDEIFGMETTINPKNENTILDVTQNSILPNNNSIINNNKINTNKTRFFLVRGEEEKINYIHLRILDIRKNEHFGGLLMFLNKTTCLTLRVKSSKAELYCLKKTDAIEISSKYPNIWKRINKVSFHNLNQISKQMLKIIKQYCNSYGIKYDILSMINKKKRASLYFQSQLKSENSFEAKSLNKSLNKSSIAISDINNLNNKSFNDNKNNDNNNESNKLSLKITQSKKFTKLSNSSSNSIIYNNSNNNTEVKKNLSNILFNIKHNINNSNNHRNTSIKNNSTICNKSNHSIKNKIKKEKKKNRANSSKTINNLAEKIKCVYSNIPRMKRSKSKITSYYIHRNSINNIKNKINKCNKSIHSILTKSISVDSHHLGKNYTIKKTETKKITFEISKNINLEIEAQYTNINKISNFKYIKDIEYQKKLNDIVRKKYTEINFSDNSSNKCDESNVSSNFEEKEKTKLTGKNFTESSITKQKKMNSDCNLIDQKSRFCSRKTFNKKKYQEVESNKNILSPSDKKKFIRKTTKKTFDINDINSGNKEKEKENDKNIFEKKRTKKRKKPILNLVNKNIFNDTIILNNPNEFYQGLFNNIIKEKKERKGVKKKDNIKEN